MNAPDTHHMALPVGCQFEQYRIELELGHGGFGITYLALGTLLNRVVTVKENLPPDLAYRDLGSTVGAWSVFWAKLEPWPSSTIRPLYGCCNSLEPTRPVH